mmetsp:Transcript_24972/g.59584  ORF Transcript_24972/g.59584 Transcript_24972/m.59584 type:complete len:434 (+) Transcript_24972:708-2009(+)
MSHRSVKGRTRSDRAESAGATTNASTHDASATHHAGNAAAPHKFGVPHPPHHGSGGGSFAALGHPTASPIRPLSNSSPGLSASSPCPSRFPRFPKRARARRWREQRWRERQTAASQSGANTNTTTISTPLLAPDTSSTPPSIPDETFPATRSTSLIGSAYLATSCLAAPGASSGENDALSAPRSPSPGSASAARRSVSLTFQHARQHGHGTGAPERGSRHAGDAPPLERSGAMPRACVASPSGENTQPLSPGGGVRGSLGSAAQCTVPFTQPSTRTWRYSSAPRVSAALAPTSSRAPCSACSPPERRRASRSREKAAERSSRAARYAWEDAWRFRGRLATCWTPSRRTSTSERTPATHRNPSADSTTTPPTMTAATRERLATGETPPWRSSPPLSDGGSREEKQQRVHDEMATIERSSASTSPEIATFSIMPT